MANRTIILNREDVMSPIHPHLFDSFLDTLGIVDADEVYLQLSPLDHNKKMGEGQKPKAERAYPEIRKYVKDKINLFQTCSNLDGEITDRSRNILEVLQEIERIIKNA